MITYSSSLALALMAFGDNYNTWGNVTNVNLGTLLEQAIVGQGNILFPTDADLTITMPNGTTSPVRCLCLVLQNSVSLTAQRNLIIPTAQKPYIIQNSTTGGQSINVKTFSGTGVVIPNGARRFVYCDGVNVVDMITNFGTVTFTGTPSGPGITALFASPPPIGSTAPSSGAFTTLSATSTVSGAGITSLFASPPPLGSTAPNTVAATALSASGAITGTGFVNLFNSPPVIGGVAPNNGTFVNLNATAIDVSTLQVDSAFNGAGMVARFASPPVIGNVAPNDGTFHLLGATSNANIFGTLSVGGTCFFNLIGTSNINCSGTVATLAVNATNVTVSGTLQSNGATNTGAITATGLYNGTDGTFSGTVRSTFGFVAGGGNPTGDNLGNYLWTSGTARIWQCGPTTSCFSLADNQLAFNPAGLTGQMGLTTTTLALSANVTSATAFFSNWTNVSDRALKTNEKAIDPAAAIGRMMQLQPKTFDWINPKGINPKNDAGFIAQDFLQVYPASVRTVDIPHDPQQMPPNLTAREVDAFISALPPKQQGLGLELRRDFYADVVASIQYLKTRVDAIVAAHPL